MRIIEITGEPCVGKSTVINSLQKNSRFTLFDQQWLLSSFGINTKYKILNTILYEVYMFNIGLLSAKPRLSFKFFQEVMRLHEPLSRRINIYRNILHKYAIHRRALKVDNNNCLLVDEGVSHIPYLFTGGLNDKNKLLFLDFPNEAKPWIIKLSIDLDTIVARLKHRGHKRIDADQDNIRAFALKNIECSKLQDKLLNEYARVIYLDLLVEHKIENIEKTLLRDLKECLSQPKTKEL